MSGPDPDLQLQRLEEQLAFQQRNLEELHNELLAQQNEIAGLKTEVARLTAILQRVIDEGFGADLPHEKPPHY